ncbi:MAG: hypothetical protein ACXWUD_10575 [Methylosarcina sp.]
MCRSLYYLFGDCWQRFDLLRVLPAEAAMVYVSYGQQLDLDRESMAYCYRYDLKTALLISTAVWNCSLQAHEMAERGEKSLLPAIANGLLLGMVWTAYRMGSWRLRPKKGRGLVFYGTTLIAALFVFIPAGDGIEHGSALHMIQHMFIMALIAPLYLAAKPWL